MFRISKQTREAQEESMNSTAIIRDAVYEAIRNNPNQLMNRADICRIVLEDTTLDVRDPNMTRVYGILHRMEQQGLIASSGLGRSGFWSIVKVVGKIKPTYQKPKKHIPVEVEEPTETQVPVKQVEAPIGEVKVEPTVEKTSQNITITMPQGVTITINL